jgi:hypothetical protein
VRLNVSPDTAISRPDPDRRLAGARRSLFVATPMRAVADGFDWQPIDSAPFDEDVTLLVTDGRGAPYRIPYPCKLNSTGWVNSRKGMPLAVTPMGWKP